MAWSPCLVQWASASWVHTWLPLIYCKLRKDRDSIVYIFITPQTAPSTQWVGWLIKPNSKQKVCMALCLMESSSCCEPSSSRGRVGRGPSLESSRQEFRLTWWLLQLGSPSRRSGPLFSLENEAALHQCLLSPSSIRRKWDVGCTFYLWDIYLQKLSHFHNGFPNISIAKRRVTVY